MTEICTGYPGEKPTKAVGPKDGYHESYPGYWNKSDKVPNSNAAKTAPANVEDTGQGN